MIRMIRISVVFPVYRTGLTKATISLYRQRKIALGPGKESRAIELFEAVLSGILALSVVHVGMMWNLMKTYLSPLSLEYLNKRK